MKLQTRLSEQQQQRVQTALGTLQSAHAAFEARLETFAETTAQRGVLESQLAVTRSRRFLVTTRETAEALDTLTAQIGQAKLLCEARQPEMEAARQNVLIAIQRAGKVIHDTAAPLVDQFKQMLADALQPLCTEPAKTAMIIQEHHTEFSSLVGFLQRGQHVSKTAGPPEIESFVF